MVEKVQIVNAETGAESEIVAESLPVWEAHGWILASANEPSREATEPTPAPDVEVTSGEATIADGTVKAP